MLKKILYIIAFLSPMLSESDYVSVFNGLKIPTLFYMLCFLWLLVFDHSKYTFSYLKKNTISYFMISYLLILALNNYFVNEDLFWYIKGSSSVLWLSTLKRVLFVFLVFWVFETEKEVIKYMFFYLMGLFSSVIASYVEMLVFHHAIFDSTVTAGNEGYLRATGFFENPNVFGFSVVILLAGCIYYFQKTRNNNYMFMVPILIYPLLSSYSRSSWLSTVFALLVIVFVLSRRISKVKLLSTTVVFLVFLYLVVVDNQSLRNRFLDLSLGDASVASRLISMNISYELWLKNPILGIGANKTATLYEGAVGIHNFYLHSLFETGIIGFVITIGFMATILSSFNKFRRSKFLSTDAKIFSEFSLIIIIVYYFQIFFGNNIQDEFFWFLISIQFVFFKIEYDRKSAIQNAQLIV